MEEVCGGRKNQIAKYVNMALKNVNFNGGNVVVHSLNSINFFVLENFGN
jgi:hypothetical protein